MTNVFLHIKLVGVGLETRLGQDHFRTEGRSFKGDRCDIYIDFLDFMSQRVWKEDLSMSDQISTNNSLGWFDSALHLALQFCFVLFFTFEASGPGLSFTWERDSHLSLASGQFCNDRQPPSQGAAAGANIPAW